MKKYQQLFLIIFSLISLTLFLVYRHEYNRLHYILEVFNFFGTPCNFSEFTRIEKVLDHYDWGQIPLWQEDDTFYTFSGFSNRSSAQVIAISRKGSRLPKKCFVWYDDKEENNVGKLTINSFGEDMDHQAYIFDCKYKNVDHLPYAVAFSSKSNFLMSRKVILTNTELTTDPIKITVCVPPRNFDKREFIEFLSFHKLIGIKYYIFYQNDIPNHLKKYINNLADVLDIQVTFLTWNFPKYSNVLPKIIVGKDCMFRTSKKSKASIILSTNEYLVPVDSYSIYPLFEEPKIALDHVDIPIQQVCITSNETFRPIAIQNTKTWDNGKMEVRRMYMNIGNSGKKNFNENKFQLAIYGYDYCTNISGRTRFDATISRYSTDLIRSTLIQLLIHNQV